MAAGTIGTSKIDSTTALYWARNRDKRTTAITFDYGQKNRVEIQAARKITARLEIPQTILQVDLGQIGGSPLTDPSLSLPRMESITQIQEGLPETYVPFRNGIFLALAAAWAETQEISGIVCGFNVIDSTIVRHGFANEPSPVVSLPVGLT